MLAAVFLHVDWFPPQANGFSPEQDGCYATSSGRHGLSARRLASTGPFRFLPVRFLCCCTAALLCFLRGLSLSTILSLILVFLFPDCTFVLTVGVLVRPI